MLVHAEREHLRHHRVSESIEHEPGKPVALAVGQSVAGRDLRQLENAIAQIDRVLESPLQPLLASSSCAWAGRARVIAPAKAASFRNWENFIFMLL